MTVDYLRVSVTDRCNLRCIYCNPLGGGIKDRREILSFDEILRAVRLFVECGVRKVRLTGGEPLMRDDIVRLVRSLAAVSGIDELSMTTNGLLLAPMASALKDAGLQRVNISMDAAEASCYRQVTGFDALSRVVDGIHRAIEAGLNPVRINCVVMSSVNLSQVQALAEMSLHLPVSVRFIEYCPTSRCTGPASRYVPNRKVREIIESRFGPLSSVLARGSGGPAVYFRLPSSAGTVGFISGRSSMFCHQCSRLRLTSDGKIRPCLHASQYYDLRRLLREPASDEAIRDLIRNVLREKGRFTRLTSTAGDFLMQSIGG